MAVLGALWCDGVARRSGLCERARTLGTFVQFGRFVVRLVIALFLRSTCASNATLFALGHFAAIRRAGRVAAVLQPVWRRVVRVRRHARQRHAQRSARQDARRPVGEAPAPVRSAHGRRRDIDARRRDQHQPGQCDGGRIHLRAAKRYRQRAIDLDRSQRLQHRNEYTACFGCYGFSVFEFCLRVCMFCFCCAQFDLIMRTYRSRYKAFEIVVLT